MISSLEQFNIGLKEIKVPIKAGVEKVLQSLLSICTFYSPRTLLTYTNEGQ